MEYLGTDKVINQIDPLVSVCLQVYNNEDYIQKCISSILQQQTNFPIEIIIGEDDSTDKTREICKKLAEENQDKIRLFLRSEKDKIFHKGKKTSRFNFMSNLYSARGKYIALCDGDDYWISHIKLRRQVEILEKNLDLIAVHHWQKYAVLKDGIWHEISAPTESGFGYCNDEISDVRKIFKNEMRVKARTVLFRNVITPDFLPSWFTKVAFADVSLSFLLGKKGKFYFIDESWAVYRQSPTESLSTAGIVELGLSRFRVEHLQNYIEIWDYVNRYYNFKYNKESQKTVRHFYSLIIKYMPDSYKNYFNLLHYNNVDRKIPFYRSAYHNWFLLGVICKMLFKKSLNRLRKKF